VTTDGYRAGGARGEVARGTAENSDATRGVSSSRSITGIMAMPGVGGATTDPTVEQVGQKCEADGVAVRSTQKWNCAARKTIPRSKTKMRARSVQTGMYLLRRSLGRIGCAVKELIVPHWFLIATNLPYRPSKMLS